MAPLALSTALMGVSTVRDCPHTLLMHFYEPPTAADMRHLHDALRPGAAWPWISPKAPPPAGSGGSHAAVEVLGVVNMPQMYGEPFVDLVAYWPASGLWTVTHHCGRDGNAVDHPVDVVGWFPKPPVPALASELWRAEA